MEHVWNQTALDLKRDFGMGYIELSKHLKQAQFSWHGMCKALDAALEAEEPREEMTRVLLRNMYVDEEGDPHVDEAGESLAGCVQGAQWLASYLLQQRAHVAIQ